MALLDKTDYKGEYVRLCERIEAMAKAWETHHDPIVRNFDPEWAARQVRALVTERT